MDVSIDVKAYVTCCAAAGDAPGYRIARAAHAEADELRLLRDDVIPRNLPCTYLLCT